MHAHRPLTAALAVICLSLAAPAAAQSPNDTGMRVAHALFSAVDMAGLVREGAVQNAAALTAFEKIRPAWKGMFLDAVQEAILKDQAGMETAMARTFARDFSDEELSAALTVFSDPQAKLALAAAARHQPLPKGASACSQACMRAMNSPAGRSFLTKFSKAFSGPELQSEMMAAVVPDLFIIFGEKAKAAEAKSAAGL
jgi:hypothetical protein